LAAGETQVFKMADKLIGDGTYTRNELIRGIAIFFLTFFAFIGFMTVLHGCLTVSYHHHPSHHHPSLSRNEINDLYNNGTGIEYPFIDNDKDNAVAPKGAYSKKCNSKLLCLR
jgi:hypothetical protein